MILKMTKVMITHKNCLGKSAAGSFVARNMAVMALMWATLPKNQWPQLNSHRLGASGCGLKRAPIGLSSASVKARDPKIWCQPYE